MSGLSFGGESYLCPELIDESKDFSVREVSEAQSLEAADNPFRLKEQQQQLQRAKRMRHYAIEVLARREHSRFELISKLQKRFPDCQNIKEISDLLSQLCDEGWQSETRFTEAYTRMRWKKGFGPQRIAMELKERGVDHHLIDTELTSDEYDWYLAAVNVREKKFSLEKPDDFKLKAKQQNFLNYRGFTSAQIKAAF